MAQRIPHVVDGVLHVPESPGGPKIAVGSPSWIAWLTDPTTRSFAFRSSSATYTARKERRARGGEYWTAYRRQSGRLRKAYLGKAEDLTLDRLDDAAEALSGHGNEVTASPTPDATAGDARPARADGTATKGSTTADEHVQERSHRAVHGDQLLLTKLSVPSARPSLVPRPRLSERLEEGMGGKLTLVSAPAGFGKTTLLSAWISDLSGGRPVAWLSLDSGDNDPARFWRYSVTAIDQLKPGSGETALALLGSPQAPPIEAILTTLLNKLGDLPTVAVLVLDDYHLIETQAIHGVLTFLIEHFPPRMHLVISTRADPPLPLSRLRACGEMAELRAADLRFTPEETATFLNQAVSLQLTAEDIAELEEHTEGWIAGLQLAALAMRDHADIPGFIAAFTGSNRYVLDYLAEEVLGRQAEALRTFLLRTSVLDRMCASLCDAVASGDNGQEILEHLEHANLFVIPLDEDRGWYRYHHLFTDVLRQRLRQTQANLVPELHRRASAWFERQGLAAEAVQHSLAAADWEGATRMLVQTVPSLVFRGQFHTALAWLDALPDAIVRAHPTLCVYHAGVLMYTKHLEAAELRLQDAERGVQRGVSLDEASVIRGQVATIRGAIARISGDLALCVTLSRQALDLLPEPEVVPLKLRSAAVLNASRAFLVSGDVTPASENSVASVVAPVRVSGNRYAALGSMTNLARLCVLQGRLRQARATYEEAMQVVSGPGEMQALVGGPTYYFGMGDLHREWNNLGAAESHLAQGMELVQGTLTVDADVVLMGYLSLACLQQALGDGDGALVTLEDFAQLARRQNFSASLLTREEAARARVQLAQGDLAAAIRWAEESGLHADGAPSYPREEEYLTLVRVLIAQGSDDAMGSYLDDALDLIDRLFRAVEGGGRMGSVIEILALRALALQARHESGEALATLERALVFAQPEGYVRLFVDEGAPMEALLWEHLKARRRGARDAQQHPLFRYVRQVLAAFESPHADTTAPPPPPGVYAQGQDQPLPEHLTLTAREREVLELITEGLSNQEIASRLFIATSTVKGYVHSILRKLEVDSRTKAISRAHELHLISE